VQTLCHPAARSERDGRLFYLIRAYIEARRHIVEDFESFKELKPMTDVVEEKIEASTLEQYDSAIRSGDTDWLNGFWDDVADQTGYTKEQLINAILDEYNSGDVNKTALDYYMSTLANWPGANT
jgi:hypothetical protein